MNDLRVLIVADDPLTRTGLATLLADQPGCVVVGQLDSEAAWPVDLSMYRPDILLWDLGWSPEAALAAAEEVTEVGLPVVGLIPDENHAAEAWGAGLRGLLLRNVDGETLLTALIAAAQELVTLDPLLAEALLRPALPDPPPLVEALTPREAEVLQLLAEGLPNKAIARRLDISDHTVKFHVNAIMSKLGAQSRTEAVVRATRLGLILL